MHESHNLVDVGDHEQMRCERKLPYSREKSFGHVADLPLAQRSRFAPLWFVAFAQLELCYRDRSILAVSLGLSSLREAGAEYGERVLHDIAVLSVTLLSKYLRYRIGTFWRVFEAVDQIVSIFALEALVKRKRLQAGEADQVCMLDPLDCDAIASQQFRFDLDDLMQVEDDGGMRDVECFQGPSPRSKVTSKRSQSCVY